MKLSRAWLFLLLAGAGCYQRQDPLVRAAQDLREAAYEFAKQEEMKQQQFNLLELGMSTSEVLKRVGPPSSRQSLTTGPEESRELWTYQRAMRSPTLLTFTNQRLSELRLE